MTATWLPAGKSAAVCFSIDDVHPAKSTDAYEAGGDLGKGALGLVERLLEKHPALKVTLFTTPDWREISPVPTRKWLARIPVVRDHAFLTPILPSGTMRLDRHPEFVAYLKSMPRTEVGLHGLHHIHTGHKIMIEFQEQSAATCSTMLQRGLEIFREAKLEPVMGMTPPGWNAPAPLLDAMGRNGFKFVGSARDLFTPVTPGAVTAMSGLRGVPLYAPVVLDNGLVHIPTNFQATSPKERAFDIVEMGGLLSVKAHIVKYASGYPALDGIDELYCNYLDSLFTLLEQKYGDRIWWTSMSELADAMN
jgi:hypothetical protein